MIGFGGSGGSCGSVFPLAPSNFFIRVSLEYFRNFRHFRFFLLLPLRGTTIKKCYYYELKGF